MVLSLVGGIPMNGYVGNIEKLTTANINFRTVLYTAKHCQLVLMSLAPGEDIGEEIHADNDQFFRFEFGKGVVTIDGVSHDVFAGSAVIIPAGAKHNVANASLSDPSKCIRSIAQHIMSMQLCIGRNQKHVLMMKNLMG